MKEWVSIEDKMPIVGRIVISTGKFCGMKSMVLCHFDGEAWRPEFGDSKEVMIDITHWMPLPEPPHG